MSGNLKQLIESGRKHFIDGDYENAEAFLTKAIRINSEKPEIYQMLATIYYDRGKFKRAIQTFKRALDIDPDYTDASVGLSIVLNDIGQYQEGQKIFDVARKRLDKRTSRPDEDSLKLISKKHIELGQLYISCEMHEEAIDQFKAAAKLNPSDDLELMIANCLKLCDRSSEAIHQLQMTLRKKPDFLSARLLLGKLLYEQRKVAEAVGQWENILLKDPSNEEAKKLIRNAQAVSITDL